MILGHLVRGLEHGLAGGQQVEVLPQRPKAREDLGLGHRVQRAPPPVQHQRDVRERLQSRPELALRAPDALRDCPDLAGSLGEDRDDPVGLTELDPRQDDALFLVERHVRMVPPARARSDALDLAIPW